MKIKILILILILVLTLSLVLTGLALANGGPARTREVLSGGASDSANTGGTTLRATLGQPVVGVVTSSGGDITLGQGFWHGGAAPGYNIFLPLVIRQ